MPSNEPLEPPGLDEGRDCFVYTSPVATPARSVALSPAPRLSARIGWLSSVSWLRLASLLLVSSTAAAVGGPSASPVQAPACQPTSGRAIATFSSALEHGQAYAKRFGHGFAFSLRPIDEGWEIRVRVEGRDENIARLTPPFHFVPNPRYIEGWHFRNSDNTGPNDGSVNAPQEIRDFIFSPEVGRTIDGPQSHSTGRLQDVEKVELFGRGRLTITDYRLTGVARGQQARMVSMAFTVCLTWPADDGKTKPQ